MKPRKKALLHTCCGAANVADFGDKYELVPQRDSLRQNVRKDYEEHANTCIDYKDPEGEQIDTVKDAMSATDVIVKEALSARDDDSTISISSFESDFTAITPISLSDDESINGSGGVEEGNDYDDDLAELSAALEEAAAEVRDTMRVIEELTSNVRDQRRRRRRRLRRQNMMKGVIIFDPLRRPPLRCA